MLSFPSIHCEYLLVMLTHVLALSNYAHSLLAALPTFEASSGSRSTMSSEDQKKTTVGLTRAVDILCQASGSAQWTAENVAPLVETARVGSGGKLGKNRWPVEASADSFRGLSM